MNEVTNQLASEINRLHQLATQKANEAINYARQAGLLLLEMKKKLPHGSFGPWIEANLQVSVRQAQRYLAVASGKKSAFKDKQCSSCGGFCGKVCKRLQDLSSKKPDLKSEIKRLQELADYRLALLTKMPSEWVGLTDQEINDCLTFNFETICRNVEAKLKEKNCA